jgi:hypothetical protein
VLLVMSGVECCDVMFCEEGGQMKKTNDLMAKEKRELVRFFKFMLFDL